MFLAFQEGSQCKGKVKKKIVEILWRWIGQYWFDFQFFFLFLPEYSV